MKAEDIAKIVAQVNPLIGIAVSAINTVRIVRDAMRAANPNDPTLAAFPSDVELIQRLITDAQLGRQEAQEFRDWLKTLK